MLSKAKIKYIQTLGQKKFRDADGVFIAEGPKVIHELVKAAPGRIIALYALQEWIAENKRFLTGIETIEEVDAGDLERISELSTPNKVLALVHQFEDIPAKAERGRITLALDAIQDPGNLGTIIRIADWFGIEQIV